VIVLDSVHDAFVRRLVEATQSLTVGDPQEPSTDVGPVIDGAAAQTIQEFIEIARRESCEELAVQPPAELSARWGPRLIGPHIFSGVAADHTIAREEIFGPVLAVMRVASFAEALELANDSVYKLTGAVYSRTPSHLDRARREFRVGNLYLNRGCTGALVGRQPFGGFGHSGVGTKAGGSDYLKHFVHPVVSCENTMRRGFAPGLEELI
jgi:RHH-type proline utilization regulon transcriptional repressor/proline dehydrogenase/delta 1-pyrroline-5-carboxylate dehydrogenase